LSADSRGTSEKEKVPEERIYLKEKCQLKKRAEAEAEAEAEGQLFT